jgi:site-specific recombinase XerD
MKAQVVLAARVRGDSGNFPVLSVQIKKGAIVLPIVRAKDKRKFGLDEIVHFAARYPEGRKRVTRSLGRDPVTAYTQYLQIEQNFTRSRAGLLAIVPEEPADKPPSEGMSISAAGMKFQNDKIAQGLKNSSLQGYMRAIRHLSKSCTKELTLVDQDDMWDFVRWLRANLRAAGKQVKGSGKQVSNTTIHKELQYVDVFFRHLKKANPLPRKMWPKITKQTPDRYSVETIHKMLRVADKDEADLIWFFYCTGFRDEEVVYCYWSDFNFQRGTINVTEKPDYGWTIKDHEPRAQDIPLPADFVKRMMARRDRRAGSKLVFAAPSADKPNKHLIDIVKKVAKRAGIEERVTLHKIRRTFGSIVAKRFGLRQAMIWLGHSNIETTQKYIAADEMTDEYSKKAVNEMFAATGD